MEQIQVLVKQPCKNPFIKVIDNDLKPLNEIVEGYIELIPHWPQSTTSRGIVAYCNEDGKRLGLTPNYRIVGDTIVGNVVFAKVGEDGETVSLSDEDITAICNEYQFDLVEEATQNDK